MPPSHSKHAMPAIKQTFKRHLIRHLHYQQQRNHHHYVCHVQLVHPHKNGTNQYECQLCRPGTFTNMSAQATCTPCPIGTYSDQFNSTLCSPCPVNSWQRFEGQTRCDECDLDNYIHYVNISNSSNAVEGNPGNNNIWRYSNNSMAHCHSCPLFSHCNPDGNITAMIGTYLLINQDTGIVEYTMCSSSACISGDYCMNNQRNCNQKQQ